MRLGKNKLASLIMLFFLHNVWCFGMESNKKICKYILVFALIMNSKKDKNIQQHQKNKKKRQISTLEYCFYLLTLYLKKS
jgi:hypothetical protein